MISIAKKTKAAIKEGWLGTTFEPVLVSGHLWDAYQEKDHQCFQKLQETTQLDEETPWLRRTGNKTSHRVYDVMNGTALYHAGEEKTEQLSRNRHLNNRYPLKFLCRLLLSSSVFSFSRMSTKLVHFRCGISSSMPNFTNRTDTPT